MIVLPDAEDCTIMWTIMWLIHVDKTPERDGQTDRQNWSGYCDRHCEQCGRAVKCERCRKRPLIMIDRRRCIVGQTLSFWRSLSDQRVVGLRRCAYVRWECRLQYLKGKSYFSASILPWTNSGPRASTMDDELSVNVLITTNRFAVRARPLTLNLSSIVDARGSEL